MKHSTSQPGFSLLGPAERDPHSNFQHWGRNTPADLGLDAVCRALSHHPSYEPAVRAILLEFCHDTAVITYRQDVLADFLDDPQLAARFSAVLPLLARLRDYAGAPSSGRDDTLHETLGRVTELNAYLKCVTQLREALQVEGAQVRSRGLLGLQGLLAQIEADEIYQSLSKTLPDLVAKLNGIPSITIGVNLDNELRPAEAVLLSINDKPFKGGSLLDRLIGSKQTRKDEQGIGPLHSVAQEYVEGMDSRVVRLPTRGDPLMVPLFRDIYNLLKPLLRPISVALRQFSQVHAGLLLPLENEIAFYLGAAALTRRMQNSGLPMCRPEVLPMQARAAHLEQMYNLLLALDRTGPAAAGQAGVPIVLNDVDFGADGRIFILTGPNQGGKTVFTQAVGLAQLVFQAGLCVPAQSARLSPLDGIYTHFATDEEFNSRLGRLSEESQRLAEIFQTLTRHSLVLLNESLSSTSPRESFYLSLDIVRALRLYEARAIFATHLHELADDLETLNNEGVRDSLVVSLVAGVALADDVPESANHMTTRTYQIRPGPPHGLSYASGIAQRFGISFEQLAARRGPEQPPAA